MDVEHPSSGDHCDTLASMEIRTERLLLREWRDEDLEPHAAMAADEEVMKYVGGVATRADSDAMIGRCRARRAMGLGPWAIEVPGVAPFVGFVGLQRTTFEAPFTPCVEVLWRLARAHWGKGYATEGAGASLRHGFEHHDLDTILSFAVHANERSWRVMERIGMKRSPDDDFDHPLVPEGSPLKRHLLYRIMRSEWTHAGSTSRDHGLVAWGDVKVVGSLHALCALVLDRDFDRRVRSAKTNLRVASRNVTDGPSRRGGELSSEHWCLLRARGSSVSVGLRHYRSRSAGCGGGLWSRDRQRRALGQRARLLRNVADSVSLTSQKTDSPRIELPSCHVALAHSSLDRNPRCVRRVHRG